MDSKVKTVCPLLGKEVEWKIMGSDIYPSCGCGSMHPDYFLEMCIDAADPMSKVMIMPACGDKVDIIRPEVANAKEGSIKFYLSHLLDCQKDNEKIGGIIIHAFNSSYMRLRSKEIKWRTLTH